jgi:hypothetical protein
MPSRSFLRAVAAKCARASTPRGKSYLGGVEVVLIVVLVAAALVLAGVAAVAALGLEPEWLARTRHSLGEARYRAGGVLGEFGDWLRLGR